VSQWIGGLHSFILGYDVHNVICQHIVYFDDIMKLFILGAKSISYFHHHWVVTGQI
jgi:hypothetical protein